MLTRQPKTYSTQHRLSTDSWKQLRKQLIITLIITAMFCATNGNSKPKSMSRAHGWTVEVENLFRFQQAGYRDELEYIQVKQGVLIDKWPETGFVKKLQRRDNTFYYYSKNRECQDQDVHKVKVYVY